MDRPSILATDLDGTLIPLPDEPQNEVDLATLARGLDAVDATLMFVTGRHFASATEAIRERRLPSPHWLICDVGTSIYQRDPHGHFNPVSAYEQHQDLITAAQPLEGLRNRLRSIDGLRLQEPEKQGRFKLSFYADAARLDELAGRVQYQLDAASAPYSLIHSVDPFNGDGLIDVLPAGVSKAHALAWWTEAQHASLDDVVFAGDSGNDLAALTAGYRAIVVGNANPSIAKRAKTAHANAGSVDRLYLATSPATSGVLAGCRHFGLIT